MKNEMLAPVRAALDAGDFVAGRELLAAWDGPVTAELLELRGRAAYGAGDLEATLGAYEALYRLELEAERPFEAAMDRFVKLDKNDFIGRDAAAEEKRSGPRLRRVSFIVDADDADVMGDEPIWARGVADDGTVPRPHGFGAPRFDQTGAPVTGDGRVPGGITDGDWRVVGWVTSGGYAHWLGVSMAQGYVPAALAGREDEELFEIEILGQRRPGRICVDPPFDPAGHRMRG